MNENEKNVLPLLTDDISQIPSIEEDKNKWKYTLIVLVGAILLYIPNSGSFGLWDCWETHYGEVARHMYETSDWLSPWWGYKEKIGEEPPSGSPFHSKPVLIFWAEALFMKLIGFGDWALRLPMEIFGILGVIFSFIILSRIYSKNLGLLSAFVLLSSPLYYFLSRQAITDMPFVSPMTIGMLFFIQAYFSPLFKISNKKFFFYLLTFLTFFLLSCIPQYVMLSLDLASESSFSNLKTIERAWMIFQNNGIYHAILYGIGTILFLIFIAVPVLKHFKKNKGFSDEFKDRWLRKVSLWTAYIFFAYATLGKGLLGFMLPGAIIFLYLLITSEWRSLKRLQIPLGILVFVLVAFPWYMGMFAKFGNTFYSRFFVHDHFNRLGTGVHQIDTGTFEHFIKWLGYGIYPWIAFIPLLCFSLRKLIAGENSEKTRPTLIIFIWAFFSYLLFTLAATKFHHYIFPALPPTAYLIALSLKESFTENGKLTKVSILLGFGIFLAVTIDLRDDVQIFRNMFTYQYDRPLPEHLPNDPDDFVSGDLKIRWKDSTFYQFTNSFIKTLFEIPFFEHKNFILFIFIAGVVSFVLFYFIKTRKAGFFLLGGTSLTLSLWCLNYYMPMLSPHWSQKYMFEDYYKKCELIKPPPEIEEAYTPLIKKIGLDGLYNYFGSTPKRICKEDVIAWLIIWRGETYYTYNEIKPIMKAEQLEAYLEIINRGKPFFALMQHARGSGLKSQIDRVTSKLKAKGVPEFVDIKEWKVEDAHQENAYFSLVKATPVKEAKVSSQ